VQDERVVADSRSMLAFRRRRKAAKLAQALAALARDR
jgi:hypothetical protein